MSSINLLLLHVQEDVDVQESVREGLGELAILDRLTLLVQALLDDIRLELEEVTMSPVINVCVSRFAFRPMPRMRLHAHQPEPLQHPSF